MNCGIGNEGAMSLAHALAKANVKLESFDMRGNYDIDQDGLDAFVRTLQHKNRTLRRCAFISPLRSDEVPRNNS